MTDYRPYPRSRWERLRRLDLDDKRVQYAILAAALAFGLFSLVYSLAR